MTVDLRSGSRHICYVFSHRASRSIQDAYSMCIHAGMVGAGPFDVHLLEIEGICLVNSEASMNGGLKIQLYSRYDRQVKGIRRFRGYESPSSASTDHCQGDKIKQIALKSMHGIIMLPAQCPGNTSNRKSRYLGEFSGGLSTAVRPAT